MIEEWKYFELSQGIAQLEKDIRKLAYLATDRQAVQEQVNCLRHTIDFIWYNMQESNITGGNGDDY